MAANGNISLEADTAETFEVVGAALEKAAAAHDAAQALQNAIQSEIPETVDALLASGLIEPEEKQACVNALANPLQTIRLLKFAAQTKRGESQELQAREVNQNGGTKTASVRGPIGAHHNDDHPANIAFDRALGLR